MASLIFRNFPADLLSGRISPAVDAFHVLLVRGYAPDAAHARRSDVERFEVQATGYDKGGKPTPCSTRTAGDVTSLLFGDAQWTVAGRIAATGGVLYKARGGASSEDELVSYLDFGAEKIASDSTFTVHFADGIALHHGA